MNQKQDKGYCLKANFYDDLNIKDCEIAASYFGLRDHVSTVSKHSMTHPSLVRWLLTKLAVGSIILVVLISPFGQLIYRFSSTFVDNLLNAEAEATKSITAEALPVSVQSVKAIEQYKKKQLYTGTVISRRQTNLGFERTGKLVRVWVDEGEKVVEGQPLAQLDLRGLKAEMQQVMAKRDATTAKLKELRAGPRIETIDIARSETERMAAQLKLARERHDRRAQLLSQGAITREQFDVVLSEFEAAKASYKGTQKQLDKLLAGSRPEQIEAQEALIRQLDADITSIKVEIENSILRAPFSGKVSQRLLDEGFVFSILTAGQPILQVVENDFLDVHVGVPVEKTARLVQGSSHMLQIDGEDYMGTVSGTIPILNKKTRSKTIVLTLNTSGSADIIPGQVARLKTTEIVSTSGYWLPIDAITENANGLWSCYVLGRQNQSKNASTYEVELMSVEVLHTDGQQVFVRGTLKDNDLVITSGSHRLVPGQLVRPVLSN